MKLFSNRFIIAICILATSCKEEKAPVVVTPEVNVVEVGQRTIPVYTEYVGQTYGISDVQIRSRVDGWLLSMNFKEGGQVQKGQLLYVVDDLPILTRIDAAEATLAKAKTMMVKAKSDLDRVEPLAKMNALSQRDLDAAAANYDASKSEVNVASASLATAKIELGYTHITSPVSGIIGISNVMKGDYIGKASVGKPLNTVSAVGDIRVRFPISESEYLRFAKKIRSGTDELKKIVEIPVTLVLADGSTFTELGKIDLANRQVDPETGSILMQAIFANKQNLLRPGQYVKVRFTTDEYKDAVLIPQQAVSQLQSIYRVFLVNDSSKLENRVVQAGVKVGSNWIITSGLKAGEKVAIVGSAAVNLKNQIKQIPMKWNYDSTSHN